MSVKINVNGSFKKCNRSNVLLDDPQRVRKDEEKNRRKLRLLQVREKSKNIAQKIRYEVAAEKERHLKNLEEAKAKELDVWRKDMVKRHSQAYCLALGEIGQAHREAKKENQKSSNSNENNVPKRLPTNQKKCTCCKESKCTSTQTDKCEITKSVKCVCNGAEPSKSNEFTGKRKRSISLSSSSSDSESEIDRKGRFELEITASSCSDSSSSSSSGCENSEKKTERKKSVPRKVPGIVLDVEIGSDDSIEIVSPRRGQECQCNVVKIRPSRESKKDKKSADKKVQSRSASQHSSESTSRNSEKDEKNADKKVRSRSTSQNSPESTRRVCKKGEKNADTKAQSGSTSEKSSESTTRPSKKNKKATEKTAKSDPASENTSELASLRFSPTIKPVLVSKKSNEEKRFTLVSNLIKKHQKTATVATSESSGKGKSSPSKQSTTTSQSHSGFEAPAQSQKTSSSSSKNVTAPQSRQTYIISNDCSSTSGRVQFYDYNSKQSKEYAQTSHVTIDRQQDRSKPNAMEDAAKEKQLQKERERIRITQNKKMEERGQKALGREQVRQDCNELTEKLEALTKQYPRELPTRDNTEHFFEDKRLRNETKLNSAVEELLSRPTIITCSEVYKPGPSVLKTSTKSTKLQNELNLGGTPLPADDVSSDSCCSILLDYVEDQSKQLHNDLQNSDQNQEKAVHLKILLKRLDEFRNCLVREFKNESEKSKPSRKDDIRHMVESVTDLLKECYNTREQKKKDKGERESTKEKFQKVVLTDTNKPLEIVITVKGNNDRLTKVSGIKKRPKKGPSKLAAVIESSHIKTAAPEKKQQKTFAKMRESAHLYDSNSTSYQSLPPEVATKLDDLMKQKASLQKDNEPGNRKIIKGRPPPPLNPLIAQYIQRLLAMSHGDIQNLEASSSEIETPSSSVINTPNNLTSSSDIISNERLEFIQTFIEDNRSFIKELEQTLDSRNTLPAETSIRLFNDVWRKRLLFKEGKMPKKIAEKQYLEKPRHTDARTQNKHSKGSAIEKRRPSDDEFQKKHLNATDVQKQTLEAGMRRKEEELSKPKVIKQRESKTQEKEKQQYEQEQYTEEEENEEPGEGKKEEEESLIGSLSSESSGRNTPNEKVEKPTETSPTREKAQKVDKAIETNIAETPSIVEASQRLTENCALRIAELTELIHRVRKEKQRLLEATLSSASDTGLQSTEYLELPECSESDKRIYPTVMGVNSKKDKTKLTPLSKVYAIGDSRDSGIYDSRPPTAQGECTDVEPDSHASPEQHNNKQQRKLKPPPTIQRFSPQFAEAELPHELSTILEVETPATSNINAGQNASESAKKVQSQSLPQLIFPTFEQYVKRNNLDITQLDASQNTQLLLDFCKYIDKVQRQHQKSPPKYKEFPTAKDYMQHVLDSDSRVSQCGLSEASTEAGERTDLKTVSPVSFHKSSDYTICITSDSTKTNQQLMASKNAEKCVSSNECESVNIEDELKKRNILKDSFRSSKKKTIVRARSNPEAEFFADVMPLESGIENLSSSERTVDSLEDNLIQLLKQWPELIRRKLEENHADHKTCAPMETKRSLSIREFLTKELLKHAALSSSLSSSSEDSLCNQFLLSIIGSLTPRQSVKEDKKLAPRTAERQVTSTPVDQMQTKTHSTNNDSSDISSHLFTGESTISSVRYQQQRNCCLLLANDRGHTTNSNKSSST
uniref:Uncharacterized protein n=1 Tax=Glossina brevipalpis TaxID=37001 RepID=A0A1A9X2R3_9MUSC